MTEHPHNTASYPVVKRGLDFVAAGLLLVFLAPVLGVIALLVRVRLGSPVLFVQDRPGRNGEVFTLFKFRTMVVPNPQRGLVSDHERMTSFGQTLRSTSLDELPSLWNIFKGEMSFVGPRPLLVEYLERYSPEQRNRHLVRPGLTGLAQVSGRNLVAWDDRFKLDVEYVDRTSLGLDAKILLRTLTVVLARTGISSGPDAALEDFLGPMSFAHLELRQIGELDLPQMLVSRLEPLCNLEDLMPQGLTTQNFQRWLALRTKDPTCHDWVGVDPTNSQPLSMCGLSVNTDRTAELYLAVANPRNFVNEDTPDVGLHTLILATSQARDLGIAHLRMLCARSNGSLVDLFTGFGFEIIEAIGHLDSYFMSFDTKLRICDEKK